MNFIVYLLVLVAWAPSFGFSQDAPAAGSVSPTGGVNAGVDANVEIAVPVMVKEGNPGLVGGIMNSIFGGGRGGGLF